MARAPIRRRGSTWTVILTSAATRQAAKPPTQVGRPQAPQAALRDLMPEVDRGTYVARPLGHVGGLPRDLLQTVEPCLRPTTWNGYRIAAERVAKSIG
jgi:hypothetical protein